VESLGPSVRNLSSTFYIGSVGEYYFNNNVRFVTQEYDFDLGSAFAGGGGKSALQMFVVSNRWIPIKRDYAVMRACILRAN